MTVNKTPESTSIIVVDDTSANLKLLQEMLRAKGYLVLTFLRGAMALKAAAKSPPDLILLDINMPEMNGFEVCKRLKADEMLKDIPVIFISALTETADKVKAFAVGGVDYITKLGMVNDLLDMSAIESGHLTIERRMVDITVPIERIVEINGMFASPKNISIAISCQEQLPHVYADINRIEPSVLPTALYNHSRLLHSGKGSFPRPM